MREGLRDWGGEGSVAVAERGEEDRVRIDVGAVVVDEVFVNEDKIGFAVAVDIRHGVCGSKGGACPCNRRAVESKAVGHGDGGGGNEIAFAVAKLDGKRAVRIVGDNVRHSIAIDIAEIAAGV